MSCYHPLYVTFVDGKFGRFGGKLTDTILNNDYLNSDGCQVVPVPCGKCEGCRLDRSRAWADRMLLEYEYPPEGLPKRTALFITLTYDDDHINMIKCSDGQYRGNLVVRDVQLFVKRLRKAVSPSKLRFFLCGEYGEHTFRPHYHMILFGIPGFPDAVEYSIPSTERATDYYSPTLASLWKNGNIIYSQASYQTFAYVARYVLKKQFGSDGGDSFYRGRKPPFITMSRRPGIGMTYFQTHDDFSAASVFDGDDVKSVARPRASFNQLKRDDPYIFELLQAEKREYARKRQKLVMSQTDLDLLSKLKQDEIVFKGRMKNLHKRDF